MNITKLSAFTLLIDDERHHGVMIFIIFFRNEKTRLNQAGLNVL